MYNEIAKKATIKYIKEKQKELHVRIKNEEYDNIVVPAAKMANMPVVTFIKAAIYEKIERDFPELIKKK